MAIVKRGKKWQAAVDLPGANKRKRKTKLCNTKAEAKEWVAEQEAALKGIDRAVVDNNKLVRYCIDEFLDHTLHERRTNTYTNYKSDLKSRFSEVFGLRKIQSINYKMLKPYIESLRLEGLSDNTVNRHIGSIKAFFKWALHKENPYVFKDPTILIEKYEVLQATDEFKFFDFDECDEFLEIIKGHQYREYFLFILNTGVRIAEFTALQVKDYKKHAGVIDVNKQIDRYIARPRHGEKEIKNAYVFGPCKGALPRKIRLNKTAIKIIEKMIKGKDKDDFIFDPIRKDSRSLKTILTKRGAKPTIKEKYFLVSNNFYKDQFLKIIQKHNLKSIGLHGLRRTFGSHFVMKGGKIKVLQKILGHKSIETTMIYIYLTQDYMQESVDILDFN